MKKLHLMLCAALLAAPVAAHEGHDHEGKAGDAKQGACKADAEKFCKDIKPGEGRIMDCLKTHKADLSEGCKAKGGEPKQVKMDWDAVCAKDKESLCKDVQPGAGRIIQCFKEHEKELSAGCRAFVAKKKSEMSKKHPGMQACEADKGKFCADIMPGEGRIIECMKSHKDELSGDCRDFMAKKGRHVGKEE